MLATLIPFFLVARLAVDETAWQYGPEYVFDLDNNLTSIPLTHDGIRQTNYTAVNLFCRPKGADMLNCHIGNVRQWIIDVTNDNNIDVPKEEIRTMSKDDYFEIKFNNRGIDHLIVDEKIFTYDLNNIKVIVELFSIGADLNGKPDGSFETAENSTVGTCNVTIGIHHFPSKETVRKMSNQRFELESLPPLNKVPGEAIDIHKTRNLNNCSCYADFYYGIFGENTVVEKEIPSHLITSTARIFISDSRFVSSATRTATFGSQEYKNLQAITENMSLTLKDIRPAKEELREIPRASRTTITANSMVDKISDMK